MGSRRPKQLALGVLPRHVRVVVERHHGCIHARVPVLVHVRPAALGAHAEQQAAAQPVAVVRGEHAREEAGPVVHHGNDLDRIAKHVHALHALDLLAEEVDQRPEREHVFLSMQHIC